MPITIQQRINPEQRTAAAPNQYQDASGATPEAFGALEGQALQHAGKGLVHAGSQLAEIGEQQKHEDNARQVLDLTNNFNDQQRVFKYGQDGNGGELARQGEEALGGTTRTADWYKQTQGSLSDKITDPKAKLQFSRILSAQRDADLNTMAAREAENRKKAAADVTKVAIQNTTQKAVENATDEAQVQAQMNLGVGAIRSNIAGAPKEVVEAAVEAYKSDVQVQRIQRLAIDSPTAAADLYGRVKGDIAGADHIKVEKVLEPLRARQEGQAIAGEILGQPGPQARTIASVAGPISGGRVSLAGVAPPAIAAAVQGQESGGRAGAVSPAGAAGPMQVMPDTAREISRQRGDSLIGPNDSDAEVRRILKDPNVGQVYGETYLNAQLKRFGGNIPAALVAYNAGPAVAEKWLKERSGPNDLSGLPAETQKYVPETMARIARASAGDPSAVNGQPDVYNRVRMGNVPPPGQKMTADNWSLKFYKPEDMLAPSSGGRQVDARSAVMADTLGQRFFEATGIRVPINDTGPSTGGTAGRRRGVSDPNDNPHVEHSQHLDGRAFDFQVQKLSADQKRQFLTMAREVGFSGVGFYEGSSGHLHLDTGKARSWGGLPSWAGNAMGTPALGSSDVAVASSLNGLPVPASMRAAAGGTQTGASRLGSSGNAGADASFLPPALSFPTAPAAPSLSSQAVAASFGGGSGAGGSLVPPAVPTSVRLDQDFDPAALRQQVDDDARLDTPAKRAAAKAMVERHIRAQEGARKSMLRDLRNEGIRAVQSGKGAEDLDPDVYSSLLELDPKFVTDTLPAMEERIRKRADKTDPAEYYRIRRMGDEQFADYDLTQSRAKLSQSDFQGLADKQNSVTRSTAADRMKWAGEQSFLQMANMSLKAAGIFPDKDDADANRRAGVFFQALEARKDTYETANKKAMPPEELKKAADMLLTPVNGQDWTGKTQYLFEQGTPEENDFRRRNQLPLVGTTGELRPAAKLEDVPRDALQTLFDNHTAFKGEAPNPAQSMKFYNDNVALSTGRQPTPDTATRTEIIAGLRRRLGPGIQTDKSRAAELEERVQRAYSDTIRALFTPRKQ